MLLIWQTIKIAYTYIQTYIRTVNENIHTCKSKLNSGHQFRQVAPRSLSPPLNITHKLQISLGCAPDPLSPTDSLPRRGTIWYPLLHSTATLSVLLGASPMGCDARSVLGKGETLRNAGWFTYFISPFIFMCNLSRRRCETLNFFLVGGPTHANSRAGADLSRYASYLASLDAS